MKKIGSKRYIKLKDISKKKEILNLEDAIKKVKENCTTKFDESIDVSFFLNLKNKKEEVGIRTVVNLPNGNGKKIKIAVLCEEGKVKEAKDSGAEIAGSENLITDIQEGKINFAALLILTRQLLENQPIVRQALKERIKFLFIDEFQDTDPLQAEIIFLLGTEETGITNTFSQHLNLQKLPNR